MPPTRPPRRTSVSHGHSDKAEPVKFDADTAEGVDPEGAWRFQNSTKFQRKGSTSAERAGMDPSYTPGYGRASSANRPMGFTPDFDALFTPQLGAQIPKATPPAPAIPANLPPAATPAVPPVTPSPGDVSRAAPSAPMTPAPTARPSTPNIITDTGTQSAVRTAIGLPAGQSASASFVPGQNTKANLAKRTRPPVDPLS